MKQRAYNYLNKKPKDNVGMLECLKYHEVDFIYNETDGVFMLDKTSGIYMLSTDSTDAAKRAVEGLEGVNLVVCHSEHDYLVARDAFDLYGLNKCHQIIWERGKLPLSGVCEVKKLEPTDENVDFVFKNYTLAYTKEHIREEIENIGMLGAYVDGILVGFIGRHDEMSMGLLEVLPEYRRRGIASELENSLINEILSLGQIPYGHIIEGNEKSLSMHKARKFTFTDNFVYWIFKSK